MLTLRDGDELLARRFAPDLTKGRPAFCQLSSCRSGGRTDSADEDRTRLRSVGHAGPEVREKRSSFRPRTDRAPEKRSTFRPFEDRAPSPTGEGPPEVPGSLGVLEAVRLVGRPVDFG